MSVDLAGTWRIKENCTVENLHGHWIADTGGKTHSQLIAAAPELLEACLRIQAQFRQSGVESKAGSLNPIEDNAAQIDAVILKALGQ